MATNSYSRSSPYATTPMYGKFLDLLTNRPITRQATDQLYIIDRFYHLRPDLMASDLYGKSALWWVFAARNPNSLKDPLFDFVTGNSIYVPDKTTLFQDLGL